MTFKYNEEEKYPMTIELENGVKVEGEYIESRVSVQSLPEDKSWYHFRESDDGENPFASIKGGCVAVNFNGTFISEPIECLKDGNELSVVDYEIDTDLYSYDEADLYDFENEED